MFGIGLPEMIVIFAVALIVVGPDKLPGLARSLAKGVMEMKKTLNQLKDSLNEEGGELDSVQKELRATAEDLKEKMIDTDPSHWYPAGGPKKDLTEEEIIDVEIEAEEAAAHATQAPAADASANEAASGEGSGPGQPGAAEATEAVPANHEATTR